MTALLGASLLAAALAGSGSAPPEPPAAAAAAPALQETEARDRALSYLGTIDTPIPAEQWRALGAAGASALEEVARSREALPTRRALALEGLAAIGGAAAEAALADLAEGAAEPFAVRSAAIRGLARLLPEARILPALRPVLEGREPSQLKGVAAEALVRRAPAAACALVRSEARRASLDERRHFDRALRACRR